MEFIAVDEGVAFKPHIMRPFSNIRRHVQNIVFSNHLCRVGKVLKCSFDIFLEKL